MIGPTVIQKLAGLLRVLRGDDESNTPLFVWARSVGGLGRQILCIPRVDEDRIPRSLLAILAGEDGYHWHLETSACTWDEAGQQPRTLHAAFARWCFPMHFDGEQWIPDPDARAAASAALARFSCPPTITVDAVRELVAIW